VDKENSFVSASEDGSIGLWKSDGTSMRKVSAHPGEVRQLVFHASDGDIFTIGEDKNLRVWRRDLKALTSIPLPAPARAIKLSSDNRKMSIVLENGQAFIIPSSVDELHNALNGIP
jgi:WD40 repeat protein